MSSDKLLIHLSPKQGYNKVFDVGEYNMAVSYPHGTLPPNSLV